MINLVLAIAIVPTFTILAAHIYFFNFKNS